MLPVFSKVKAGGIGGLAVAGLALLLGKFGVELPDELIATLPPVIGSLVAWLVPERVLEDMLLVATKLAEQDTPATDEA